MLIISPQSCGVFIVTIFYAYESYKINKENHYNNIGVQYNRYLIQKNSRSI